MDSVWHDLQWSFHYGKLHWLFPNGEALATWGLVIAGLIQLCVLHLQSREQHHRWAVEDARAIQQSDLQTKRWDEEDKRRSFERASHYAFGLRVEDYGLKLWCANLGSEAFVVEKIIFEDFEKEHLEHSEVRIVPAGAMEHFTLTQINLKSYFYSCVFQVVLSLKTADASFRTSPECFVSRVGFNGEVIALTKGTAERVQGACATCGEIGFFEFTNASSMDDLRGQLKASILEISKSCPVHRAEGLQCMFDHNGRRYGDGRA